MIFDESDMKTIVVEPLSSAKTTAEAAEAVVVAATASGTLGWVRQEAVWFAWMFVRMALSIALARTIARFVTFDETRKGLYNRAETYWTGGKVGPAAYSSGGFTRPGTQGSAPRPGNGTETIYEPKEARYIGSSGPFRLYKHDTIINPARQKWPCPVRYRHPCDGCDFNVADKKGRYHCAAIVKMRMIELGQDSGEDILEIVDWIRESEGS